MVKFALRFGFYLTFILLFSVIVGNGPDHDSLTAFATSPFDHYFGWIHKLIMLPVFALSIPNWYNTSVYVIAAFFLSFVRFNSILHLCIALMFATFITTGNYRIGLAAICYSTLLASMPLRAILGSLLHNATIPILLLTTLIPKSALMQTLAIVFLYLSFTELSEYLNLDLLPAINASLQTHTDPAAELGVNKVSYFGSVAYLILFFFLRQKSNIFAASFLLTALYLLTEFALFSRLLLFGKVHFILHRWSNSKHIKLIEHSVKLAILLVTARNSYYWVY